MRQDMSPYMFGSGVTLLVCTVLAWSGDGFSLFNFTIEAPAVSGTESNDELSRDAMFTGGATILGLASFGSLLSLVVAPKRKRIYKKGRVCILAAGIASGTVGSSLLMFFACCVPDARMGFWVFMPFVVVSAGMVTVWLVLSIDDLARYQKKGDRKGKEQTGDSPPP